MRIHHLDCGTLRTPVGRMVCHVLLLEVEDRLVLVGTGFGTEDVRDRDASVPCGTRSSPTSTSPARPWDGSAHSAASPPRRAT